MWVRDGQPGAGRPTAAGRAISLRNDRSGRVATCCGRAFPHFHASTRPIHQSIDPATKHGIFATNNAKDLKALRTLRPTLCELCGPHYLIAGTMTLSGMTVLSMDEILLRTEISRMRKEGTRRGASERARHGHGRDKRGPPATGTAAQTRRTKVFRRPRRWASERGAFRVLRRAAPQRPATCCIAAHVFPHPATRRRATAR